MFKGETIVESKTASKNTRGRGSLKENEKSHLSNVSRDGKRRITKTAMLLIQAVGMGEERQEREEKVNASWKYYLKKPRENRVRSLPLP